MSRFILSCTTCATRIPRKDEIAECFRHAPPAGYRAWGVAGPLFWTPGLVQWADIGLIRRRAEQAGLLHCTEVYGPAFPTDSVASAQEAANDLVLLFDAAEALASPLVVITGRQRTDVGLEATIAGIEALLPQIANRPIKLALEPHVGSQIQDLTDYEAIFARISSKQVGITLDTGHLHAAGAAWRAIIDRFSDRIYNVHIKDHIGRQSVPIGAGEVDLRSYIKALHAIAYDGPLAVELEVEDPENLPRYCAEAFTYLQTMVKDVTGQLPR